MHLPVALVFNGMVVVSPYVVAPITSQLLHTEVVRAESYSRRCTLKRSETKKGKPTSGGTVAGDAPNKLFGR